MAIQVLHGQPTGEQLEEMLERLETHIKLAVDVEREVVAGGGVFHMDCEAALLKDGSRQQDIWGADWIAATREIAYGAIINLRPRQENPSTRILDEGRRKRVAKIVERLFGRTDPPGTGSLIRVNGWTHRGEEAILRRDEAPPRRDRRPRALRSRPARAPTFLRKESHQPRLATWSGWPRCGVVPRSRAGRFGARKPWDSCAGSRERTCRERSSVQRALRFRIRRRRGR